MGNRAYKRGREDFDTQTNPYDICPHPKLNYPGQYEDYMDGWDQEAKAHAAQQEAKDELKEQWTNMSYSCPWHDNCTCSASNQGCSIETCAPWYIIKEM
jgi:hypothetical protein